MSDFPSSEDISLRMYAASSRLVWPLLYTDPFRGDEQIQAALGKVYSSLPGIESRLASNPPYRDPGKFEGFLKGTDRLRRRLLEMEQIDAVKHLLTLVREAEAVGIEALPLVTNDAPAATGTEESEDRRQKVRVALESLRVHIHGANELTEEQRKDANGYVNAIEAILSMAHPDKKVFDILVSHLGRLAGVVGSESFKAAVKYLAESGIDWFSGLF